MTAQFTISKALSPIQQEEITTSYFQCYYPRGNTVKQDIWDFITKPKSELSVL